MEGTVHFHVKQIFMVETFVSIMHEPLRISYAFLSLAINYFQVNEKLFPCKLSSKNSNLAEEAVELAVKTWGKRSLSELEAEERLSYSCEKVEDLKMEKLSCCYFDLCMFSCV